MILSLCHNEPKRDKPSAFSQEKFKVWEKRPHCGLSVYWLLMEPVVNGIHLTFVKGNQWYCAVVEAEQTSRGDGREVVELSGL